MVKQGNIYQLECFFKGFGQILISLAWQWVAAGMVMRNDEGAGISFKGFFQDLARVNRRMGNRASKELVALNQTAAGVEV
ncbi:hypothetical protein POPA111323_09245 [Polynucleobacter paneuropaeus]